MQCYSRTYCPFSFSSPFSCPDAWLWLFFLHFPFIGLDAFSHKAPPTMVANFHGTFKVEAQMPSLTNLFQQWQLTFVELSRSLLVVLLVPLVCWNTSPLIETSNTRSFVCACGALHWRVWSHCLCASDGLHRNVLFFIEQGPFFKAFSSCCTFVTHVLLTRLCFEG
jgi:hypothetical protein